MAKTNPIGVRFNKELLEQVMLKNSITTPQKALILYENSFLEKSLKPIKDIKLETKTENVIQEKPLTEYELRQMKERIVQLEYELKNPVKTAIIGVNAWIAIRERELRELKAKTTTTN